MPPKLKNLWKKFQNESNDLPPAGHLNLSATDYAARCKLILELRADLHNFDAELEIKFPRLVVIGDQSSGKSSLVEAVSGINVPRDSGTCTRCPMECILRSTTVSDSWSCTISLQTTEFDGDGECATTTQYFANPINKASLDLWIRRAQAAILSPHRSTKEFLTMSEGELKKEDPQRLQFSKNTVLVEITDPQSPDLDFVDLPGIVHAIDPPSLGEDVINMIESFIEPQMNLILIAMPVTTDWQVQAAVRLARTADPKGDRTIGILTKPDALQSGDTGMRQTWSRILANEDPDRTTKHGYYCVRLPNDAERAAGNTRDKAQNIEENFFNSCVPWNQAKYKSRCGIPNFVRDISALLVQHIEKYLPTLEMEVDRLLYECLNNIAKLPPFLSKEPYTEILLRISAFCKAFKDAVFGQAYRHFVQENKRRYSRFSQDISLTEPKYRNSFEDEVAARAPGTGPSLNLTDVRRVKEGTITWELPPHVPFDATVQLIEMYTTMWEDPALSCFDDVVTNSIKFEETLLGIHFGQYASLLKFVRELTSQERDRCRDEARKILKKILRFETRPPFTQNNAFLVSERNKWLKANAYYWSDEIIETIHNGQTVRLRWPDHIAYSRLRHRESYQELELMADAYAYFQVSHKRIIDNVPLTIEHELNQTFVNNLETLLFDRVTREGTTPGRLAALVQEDSALEKCRQRFETRRQDLLKTKEKLDAFWSLSNVPRSHYPQIPRSNASPSSSAIDHHSISSDAGTPVSM